MKIELSDNARKWQAIAREYADEYLQPHEVEAELNDGVLPDEVTKRNKQRAIELGFSAIDVPKAHGGLELSMEEQVAIWEQLGRVTNALSWCFSEPQSWMFEACSEEQIENYILPMMRGEKKDCYAITEAGPGSDVAGIEATASKDGDDYILNGEKMWITLSDVADRFLVFAKTEPAVHRAAHVQKQNGAVPVHLLHQSLPKTADPGVGVPGWIEFLYKRQVLTGHRR